MTSASIARTPLGETTTGLTSISPNVAPSVAHMTEKRARASAAASLSTGAAPRTPADFIENHVSSSMLRNRAHWRDLAPFEIFLHGICPGGSCSTGGEKGRAAALPSELLLRRCPKPLASAYSTPLGTSRPGRARHLEAGRVPDHGVRRGASTETEATPSTKRCLP